MDKKGEEDYSSPDHTSQSDCSWKVTLQQSSIPLPGTKIFYRNNA